MSNQPAQPARTVGVIGLGTMGGAIAGHLVAAGFDVVGFDVVESRVSELQARGGRGGASVADVADGADVVITSLPTIGAFRDVVGGSRGLASVDRPGLVVVETSTLPIAEKEAARAALAAREVVLLDAPLSGTGAQAKTRDLVVFVSGDPAPMRRVKGVLEAFSRAQFEVGDFGSGSKMKFIANHLVAIHNLAAAEALLLARRSGLDPQLVFEAVSSGAGTSRMFEIRGPLMLAEDYDDATMRVKTFLKDIGIISDFAHSVHCPVPLFAASVPYYEAAMSQGRADQDTASLHGVLQQLAPEQH